MRKDFHTNNLLQKESIVWFNSVERKKNELLGQVGSRNGIEQE